MLMLLLLLLLLLPKTIYIYFTTNDTVVLAYIRTNCANARKEKTFCILLSISWILVQRNLVRCIIYSQPNRLLKVCQCPLAFTPSFRHTGIHADTKVVLLPAIEKLDNYGCGIFFVAFGSHVVNARNVCKTRQRLGHEGIQVFRVISALVAKVFSNEQSSKRHETERRHYTCCLAVCHARLNIPPIRGVFGVVKLASGQSEYTQTARQSLTSYTKSQCHCFTSSKKNQRGRKKL